MVVTPINEDNNSVTNDQCWPRALRGRAAPPGIHRLRPRRVLIIRAPSRLHWFV